MNQIARTNNVSIWAVAAAEGAGNRIQGQALKYKDGGRYLIGREATEAPKDLALVVTDLKMVWLRRDGGKIVESIEIFPGDRPIARDDLGHVDKSQWSIGNFGNAEDPWSLCKYMYGYDRDTAQSYTFISETKGGSVAITKLAAEIARVQSKHPGASPVVELDWADFGSRTRPNFKIIDWKRGEERAVGENSPTQAQDEAMAPEPKPAIEPPRERGTATITSSNSYVDPFDDPIPF